MTYFKVGNHSLEETFPEGQVHTIFSGSPSEKVDPGTIERVVVTYFGSAALLRKPIMGRSGSGRHIEPKVVLPSFRLGSHLALTTKTYFVKVFKYFNGFG
jgi:hypothetical protein